MMLFSLVFGQGTWQWSNRVHNELDWSTLKTDHFNVHYHNGIEDIANSGANIAEQVLPTLLKQVELEEIPTIDIIFTTEDEIMNGYAMWTNQTFIWVDQNDAAVWLEDEKWLFQVVAHELQHIVWYNAVQTWMPEPWSVFLSQTPGWFVEGLAEYMTEKWRPYRADIAHKFHVLKNDMSGMDPHHDGYSKLLLLADSYGDSAITQIVQYRDKFKLYNFKKAFKKATGVSVEQFEETWRRTMNTYYYGYRSQKESYTDIGTTASLPITKMDAFKFSPDSLKIAITGKDDNDQHDQSLIIANLDTIQDDESKFFEQVTSLFGFFENEDDEDKKDSPGYRNEEVDHGKFHSGLAWSPDGQKLAYGKYHYGEHGSMIWDLKILDLESGKSEWVTENFRAAHPTWSPDGSEIAFVSHSNSTANLYQMNTDGSNMEQITKFMGDVSVITPSWSPGGDQIAFAKSGESGRMNIYTIHLESGEISQISDNPEVDYMPVWHPDGNSLSYTSHFGSTPNIHTINISTGRSGQVTDSSEPVWGIQWTPKGQTITAATMNDVDSVRIVHIDPRRQPATSQLNIREDYTRWRTQEPAIPMVKLDPNLPLKINSNEKYTFYQYPKHLTTLILPLDAPFAMTTWSEALGKHLFQLMGGATDWTFNNPYYMMSYVNAQHGPLWGVNFFHNINWTYRNYDGSFSGLLEKFDGWNLWTSHPVNTGEDMSSNHLVKFNLNIFNRDFIMPYDSLDENDEPVDHVFTFDGLPMPEKGNEASVSLEYKYLSRRPFKQNQWFPRQGWGMKTKLDVADKNAIGDFTYQRLTFDSFTNLEIGFGILFLRGKSIALWGSPPAQEYVGLTADAPFYLPGTAGTGGFPENMSPRGYRGYAMGDRLIFGTMEYRIPILEEVPMNILGITIGDVTGAVISDVGNTWYGADYDANLGVGTVGYEMKVGLKFGDFTLFNYAIGYAQSINNWKNHKTPELYIRYALINPF